MPEIEDFLLRLVRLDNNFFISEEFDDSICSISNLGIQLNNVRINLKYGKWFKP